MRRETAGGGWRQGKAGRDLRLKGQKRDMRGRRGNEESEDEPGLRERGKDRCADC